ncbi:MAG: hypothetical protein GEV07_12770 [Streptosporangiales bacterium]|nr:hypothetical protein [Streptosporangiales bacterium]
MPEDPRNVYDRVQAVVDSDGRLPVPMYVVMPQFPYEGELHVKPLLEPTVPEPPRRGDHGPAECPRCMAVEQGAIWMDDNWVLAIEPQASGLPAAVMIQPKAHVDLGQLDDDMAGQLGRIVVHLERAMQALDGIARVHVARWGDTDAHLNVFCYARPEGYGQLRGTCLSLWEDILPPTPQDLWLGNHKAIADAFAASYGSGEVLIEFEMHTETEDLGTRLQGH